MASSPNGKDDPSLPAKGEEVEHAYNEPDLPPMEFLLAVMHDRRTPMAARIDAAKAVSVYMHPRLAQVTQEITGGVRILIEGGMPSLPGTNIIMPAAGELGRTGPSSSSSPPSPNGKDPT